MTTFQIEIINPKAKKLLENLASMKLIRISETMDYKKEFKKILTKFRSVDDDTLTLDEIQKEVEIVRKKRYAQKK